MAITDKRRNDERVPVNSESFFFTSAVFGCNDAGGEIVLASFPKGLYQIMGAPIVEILEPFDAAAAIDVGRGTIANDNITTGGAIAVVDQDEYVKTADVTVQTAGAYMAATSDLVTAFGSGTGAEMLIRGAAANVPIIYAVVTDAVKSGGKARVHMVLMKVPTAG